MVVVVGVVFGVGVEGIFFVVDESLLVGKSFDDEFLFFLCDGMMVCVSEKLVVSVW